MKISPNNLFIDLSRVRFSNVFTLSNLLIFIVILYLLVGIFPIVPIENDGIRISIGIQNGRFYGNYDVSYLYTTHSGTYHTANFLRSIIDLSAFDTLSIYTAVSMLVFLISTSLFVRRITQIQLIIVFGSIILFQESWISGLYPNSSMPAAAALTLALLLSTGNLITIIFSGVLYAIAFWTRFDAIFTGMAFVIILAFINKKGLAGIFLFSLSSLIAGILLFSFSGINFREMVESYNYYRILITQPNNLKLTMEMYSIHFTLVVIVLFGLGVYLLLKQKNWNLLAFSLISPLPLMAAYGLHVTSSKHLLYLVIFLSIPVCIGLQNLLKLENCYDRLLMFVVIGLFIFQYIFSPPFKTLNIQNNPSFCQSCDGILLHTADSDRFRGNILYAPIYFQRTKSHQLSDDNSYLDSFLEYLSEPENLFIISYHWTASEWLLYYMQENGYRIDEFEMYDYGIRIKLLNGNKAAYLIRIDPIKPAEIPPSIQKEMIQFNKILLVDIDPESTNTSFLSKHFNWRSLENMSRFNTVELTAK